jgi:hypothetical protein
MILGSLAGGVLLLAVGLALVWYLFYRPIVNVAVQLPTSPPAAPGPDAAQVRALEDQNEKLIAANKRIEDQIALLKQRLTAGVCTLKDPLARSRLLLRMPPRPSRHRRGRQARSRFLT